MFKFKVLFKNFKKGKSIIRRNHHHPHHHHYHHYHHHYPHQNGNEKTFKLSKVLIVTKLSRYEFEKLRHPNMKDNELELMLKNRGTDYDALIYSHNLHKQFEKRIAKSFEKMGVEVKLANRVEFRTSLSKDTLKWADLLVPVGGDGTFLLAAGRASPLFAKGQHKIPIVGFNSDPTRSEGRLMLPKQYSDNPDDAVKKIVKGDFRWMHRSRIRTTLLGSNGHMPESIDLHGHAITRMEQEKTYPEHLSENDSKRYKAKMKRVLPYLALNEVFIGETLSARVSHLQIMIDQSDIVNKTKCSGLCVSTGTGSTSWHTSINRLSVKHVEDLLNILREQYGNLNNLNAEQIAEQYNRNLLFAPDDPRLCYSIREQICVGVWPIPKTFASRSFARNLFVKSKCIDASLVIDGSIAYPFNDGAKALLEVHPEDALLTISLDQHHHH